MDSIIVTITNARKTFMYDIEVPNNVPAERLVIDIAEALNGYNPDLMINGSGIRLYSGRLNRGVGFNETLEEAGVWNGDFLIILEGN